MLHHLYTNAAALPNVAHRCSHIKLPHLQVNCNRGHRRATRHTSLTRRGSLVQIQHRPLIKSCVLQVKSRAGEEVRTGSNLLNHSTNNLVLHFASCEKSRGTLRRWAVLIRYLQNEAANASA